MSAPEFGVSGDHGAMLVGADWNRTPFADFDAMAAAVPEGGVMIGAVAFEGFQQRGVVGAHAVEIYREHGRVMVRDGHRAPVDFEIWRAQQAGVAGLHGIIFNADGTAAVPLDPDNKSHGVAGMAFPIANMGRAQMPRAPDTVFGAGVGAARGPAVATPGPVGAISGRGSPVC